MAYLRVLVVGLVLVFGLIAVLIGRLRRDTGHHLPPHRRRIVHFEYPVVLTQYSDRIRALQDQALDLLDQEPLRGYANMGVALWCWFAATVEDDMEPGRVHRLGPQDPFMEVPHRNGL